MRQTYHFAARTSLVRLSNIMEFGEQGVLNIYRADLPMDKKMHRGLNAGIVSRKSIMATRRFKLLSLLWLTISSPPVLLLNKQPSAVAASTKTSRHSLQRVAGTVSLLFHISSCIYSHYHGHFHLHHYLVELDVSGIPNPESRC
jgi:hypothetical protein